MTFTPKLLASGQLANAKGTLYQTPTGMRAKITSLHCFNTDVGSLLISLYLNDGVSRQFDSHTLATLSRYVSIDQLSQQYLDETNKIEGLAGTASKVNYWIFGELEQKG